MLTYSPAQARFYRTAKESRYFLIVSEPAKAHCRSGYPGKTFEIVCEMACTQVGNLSGTGG